VNFNLWGKEPEKSTRDYKCTFEKYLYLQLTFNVAYGNILWHVNMACKIDTFNRAEKALRLGIPSASVRRVPF